MPLFAMHRREPEVSVAAHLRRRMEELARDVLSRTRVCLDIRYWIFLRDAFLGAPARPVHAELLEALTSGVNAGRLLCPLSESTYLELTRQEDPELVLASARLMDRLSRGVVIQHTIDRVGTEVRQFLLDTVVAGKVSGSPIDKVWLKIGHVIGTPLVTSRGWDAAEELIAQKSLIDVLWSVSLEEMLTNTPSPPDFRSREIKTAREMTKASYHHDVDLRSFKKLYTAELAGFWDVNEPAIRDALLVLFRTTNAEAPLPSDDGLADQVQ